MVMKHVPDFGEELELACAETLESLFKHEAYRLNSRLSINTPQGKLDFRDEKAKRGEYPCIFLRHHHFVELMTATYNEIGYLGQYSFVDAGCGLGHKLLLSHLLGFRQITGIEIEKDYIEEAEKLLTIFNISISHPKRHLYGGEITLVNKDILEVDYSMFDVIYFYEPLCDEQKEREFETQVVKTARDGAIIIGVGNYSLREFKCLQLIKDESSSGGSIFRKRGKFTSIPVQEKKHAD